MQLIQNNPYRILGLLVGATAREKDKQVRRLKQFIEADQEPEDDFSFPTVGSLNRTIESVSEAASRLNLDIDKINTALFWFYNGSHTDEPAFEALKANNETLARDIWYKLTLSGEVTQRNCSAFQNLSTLFLNQAFLGDLLDTELFEQGLILKLKYLESDFVKDFKALCTDETYKTNKKILQTSFLSLLYNETEKRSKLTTQKFLEILAPLTFSAKEDFLISFIQKPIDQLEKLIQVSKSRRKVDKDVIIAGTDLYKDAWPLLKLLRMVVGGNSVKYATVSDRVSDEILQCGIQLFNTYKDNNNYDPEKATLDLFQKAKAFAIGNIAKQRHQENDEALQEWIIDKPEREIQKKIGKEVNFVIEKINLAVETLKNKGKYPKGYNDPYSKVPFDEQPHNKEYNKYDEVLSTMSYSVGSPFNTNPLAINLFYLSRDIVTSCKPKLDLIKGSLGITNDIFKKLSNEIAIIALACLIEYVNNKGIPTMGISPVVGDHQVNAMNAIGELEMDIETRKRYNTQKQSLNNLYQATQKATSKSSGSSGGCYIATMVYGDYDHPQVMKLRQFRDEVLDHHLLGKWFIVKYYKYSPKLVERLREKKRINELIRSILNQIIKFIK